MDPVEAMLLGMMLLHGGLTAWSAWSAVRLRSATHLAASIFFGGLFLYTALWLPLALGDRSLFLSQPFWLRLGQGVASTAILVGALLMAWLLWRPVETVPRPWRGRILVAAVLLVFLLYLVRGTALDRISDASFELYAPLGAFLVLLALLRVRDDERAWGLAAVAAGLAVYRVVPAVQSAMMASRLTVQDAAWFQAVAAIYGVLLAASLILGVLAPPARRPQFAFFVAALVLAAAISAYVWSSVGPGNWRPAGADALEIGAQVAGLLLVAAGVEVAVRRAPRGADDDSAHGSPDLDAGPGGSLGGFGEGSAEERL